MKKKYKLHWKHREVEIVEGNTPAEAMNNAGIGAGALPALDYYEEIKNEVEKKTEVSK